MFRFVTSTKIARVAHEAFNLGLVCERDPVQTGVFNIECSCEDDKDTFNRYLGEQGFGLNLLIWKVKEAKASVLSMDVTAAGPEDATWQRISGGGLNYLYLIRPRETGDPKVYGVKELT